MKWLFIFATLLSFTGVSQAKSLHAKFEKKDQVSKSKKRRFNQLQTRPSGLIQFSSPNLGF